MPCNEALAQDEFRHLARISKPSLGPVHHAATSGVDAHLINQCATVRVDVRGCKRRSAIV